MAEQHDYFIREYPPELATDRPASLWRRAGDQWQHWSTISWSWTSLDRHSVREPPPASSLAPVTKRQAAELTADRQRWVRYWALYPYSRDASAGPTTVVRRRDSPERRLDEVFGRQHSWVATDAIVQFEYAGSSSPPHLEEIDPDVAERIVQQLAGGCAEPHRPWHRGEQIAGDARRALAKELGKRYAAGESIRALAASTGRSYGFVYRVLRESRVQLRGHGGDRRRPTRSG